MAVAGIATILAGVAIAVAPSRAGPLASAAVSDALQVRASMPSGRLPR